MSSDKGSADLHDLLAEQRQRLEQAEQDNRAAIERVDQAAADARARSDQD